jgi:porin
MKRARIRSARYVLLVLLGSALMAALPDLCVAQPYDVPPTWGGDFWDRPRLTGSWWGLRDELGKKGVVFDADILLSPQGVMSGGKDTGWDFWGNADYTLNIDTGKLGLWPGGFFKFYGDSSFGDSVQPRTAAIGPVNTWLLMPKPDEPSSALMNATFTQFLSTKFGVFAGKVFVLDGFKGEFTGDIRNQFMNTAVAFPLALDLVPISAYGGGVIGLPWEGVILSAMALDASGTPTKDDISEAFDNGTTVVASAQVTIKPFGLVGHQNLGGLWSDKSRLSLIQDPSNIGNFLLKERFPLLGNPGPILRRILERFAPGLLNPVQPANRENSTWAMFYGFDQYFWQPPGDPKRGIGMFFNFGAADGVTNPVKYSFATGIGGNGVIPGRKSDNFGVGWAHTQFSDNFVPFLRQQLHLGLEHEDAFEMFYNAAITQWLRMSLDLQVINTGLQKTLSDDRNSLKGVDTAVVGGVRMYIRF